MKLTLPMLTLVLCFAISGALAQEKYIGTKMCGACHKQAKAAEAYTIWSKSAHAEAFKTLQTEKANEIAKSKGLKVPAAEAPECLECHVTGGGTAKNVDKTFSIEEGVTCEACHGAASGYKTMHSKPENKDKAVKAGLVEGDASDPKLCVQCHNEKSPTFKGFKMEEYWKKIAHQLPKKSEK